MKRHLVQTLASLPFAGLAVIGLASAAHANVPINVTPVQPPVTVYTPPPTPLPPIKVTPYPPIKSLIPIPPTTTVPTPTTVPPAPPSNGGSSATGTNGSSGSTGSTHGGQYRPPTADPATTTPATVGESVQGSSAHTAARLVHLSKPSGSVRGLLVIGGIVLVMLAAGTGALILVLRHRQAKLVA